MKTIGVDLGTTNSCVYYLDEAGNPVLVSDERKNAIFPSVVWCGGPGKERVVGHRAKARLGSQPAPVIAVKRKMGTDQKVMLCGREASPVEVSAEILRHCRQLVEKATGDTVGAVVVTVPAYFDVAPRRDTQLAAVQAFFNGDENAAKGKLELQLEPEAAAYAYLADDPAEELLILVFDLGGGTFDATVLEKSPDGLAAIAFGGDPHLGGDNFDDRLASWISYRLRGGKPEALKRLLAPGRYDAETRYTVLQQVMANDISGLRGYLLPEDRDLLIPDPPRLELELDASKPEDLVRIQKLKWFAETAKMDLTVMSEVAILHQSAFPDNTGETIVDVDIDLSLDEFNLLTGDLIDRSIRATLAVVAKSGKKQSDFDRVILVGGSSRMPVVKEQLTKVFSCPVLLLNEMADKIVAQGAAMLAGDLGGGVANDQMKLEFPRQTADKLVNISGRLTNPIDDGQAFLTPIPGDTERERDGAVQGGRFHFREVRLSPNCENRFNVEVLDALNNPIAAAEISILSREIHHDPITTKITKPIRYLARSGFRDLFPEGEPLPATKTETCLRGGTEDFVSIPIYEGERELCDLRITGVDRKLVVGAEIRFSITIDRDYSVRCSAVIVSTGQKRDVDFAIEPIKMPSLEQLEKDKDDALEEIENGLATVKDPNQKAQFRRAARRLESEYAKASNANEPDSHHLHNMVGELRKIKTEVDKSQEFLKPPMSEFEGLIRVCRNLASKLDENAAVPKDDVVKRIDALDRAGKKAWEDEDRPEWERLNKEAEDLRGSLVPTPPITSVPPEQIAEYMLGWLTEIAGKVKQHQLEDEFNKEIESLRVKIRAVDLRDKDAAREKLVAIGREMIKPLEERLEERLNPETEPVGGGRVQ